MQLIRRWLCSASHVAAVVLGLTGGLTAHEGQAAPAFDPACAAYDHHWLTKIERAGEYETEAPEVVFATYLRLMEARRVCTVDVRAGLELYERLDFTVQKM